MSVNVKFVMSSIAVCAALLLAGCGGSSSASSNAGWNPPRPSGVPDATWETIMKVDPASLSAADLEGEYCHTVKPSAAEAESNAQEYPGATVEQLNAYYDYVIAYVTPLCAALPPVVGTKGLSSKKMVKL